MSTQVNNEISNLLLRMGQQPRSPLQFNKLNQSDAEIIKFGKSFLAVKTDIISDEISWGLYENPFLVGWMSVVCVLSDITAVGARPLGVVIGTQWGHNYGLPEQKEFYRGLKKALRFHKTYLLGGDTSNGAETLISCTAIGICKKNPILRTGLKRGDSLFAIGKFGDGPALGLRTLMGLSEEVFPEKLFKPKLNIGKSLEYVTAAIDVSDGLASSLSILSEINNVSFDIKVPKNFFNQRAKIFCTKNNLPQTALFFAEHGDYQHIVGVSPKQFNKFKKKFPGAIKIADVKSGKAPHRIFCKKGDFVPVQLDLVYNSNKTDIEKLKSVFGKWLSMATELDLD